MSKVHCFLGRLIEIINFFGYVNFMDQDFAGLSLIQSTH